MKIGNMLCKITIITLFRANMPIQLKIKNRHKKNNKKTDSFASFFRFTKCINLVFSRNLINAVN